MVVHSTLPCVGIPYMSKKNSLPFEDGRGYVGAVDAGLKVWLVTLAGNRRFLLHF